MTENHDEQLHGLGDFDAGDDSLHSVHHEHHPQEEFFGPFEERYKDIVLHDIIDDGRIIQVNGYDLDGRKVWIQLIVPAGGYTVKHTYPRWEKE